MFSVLLLACVTPTDTTVSASNGLVSRVDPLIATGGAGFLVGSATPAATVPFGFVKLGPDTAGAAGTFDPYHCSGYYYDDTTIEGFSHTHMHGVGVPDYGNILFMPVNGFTSAMTDSEGLRTPFDHANEVARPGYYSVLLGNGIQVELTASMHVGVHRYTWPSDAERILVLDLEHVLGGGSYGGEVIVNAAAGTLSGHMINAGGFTGQGVEFYFFAELDAPISTFSTWADDAPVEGREGARGVDLGVVLTMAESTLEMRVGVSPISVENARDNLLEVEGLAFATVAAEAAALWEEPLARFQLLGASPEEQTRFYTAVYHLLQMPTQWTDRNGQYPGFDGQVHDASGFVYHSEFSMWDTYRTAHPAYSLFFPEKSRDFAISLLTMAQQGGAFPRWPAATWEGGSMLGAPADIVLADTWLRGVQDWDLGAAWPLLRAQARGEGSFPYNGRPDPKIVEQYGYYPEDLIGGSVAWTQELAWADDALASLAAVLHRWEDAAYFEHRSYSFEHQWDPAVGFFHARYSDGTFEEDLNPFAWEEEYTEGNAWQYLWMPPAHADHLATLMGGNEAAIARLDTFMQGAKDEGLIPAPPAYYWHGNEPDIHAPFLYSLWGDQDRTAQWQRWIEDERYFNEPQGLAGNDDAGTLSAWYLFSVLGFYPIAGTDQYILGAPRYPAATFAVGDGVFTVINRGAGQRVARVLLDGVPLDRPILHHAEITAGRTLTFERTE